MRFARASDAPAVRELIECLGRDPEELEIARLVRFDPRTRAVICATALIGSSETVVGIGAIDLDGNALGEPDTLLVDEQLTSALDELLRQALVGRARASARTRAA